MTLCHKIENKDYEWLISEKLNWKEYDLRIPPIKIRQTTWDNLLSLLTGDKCQQNVGIIYHSHKGERRKAFSAYILLLCKVMERIIREK